MCVYSDCLLFIRLVGFFLVSFLTTTDASPFHEEKKERKLIAAPNITTDEGAQGEEVSFISCYLISHTILYEEWTNALMSGVFVSF